MAANSVAVVGGGLAGLAAAVELQRMGHSVDLFERGRLLGGRATSFVVNGREVDNGQHVFLACCTQFIEFVTSLGLRDALYLQDRFDAFVLARNGVTGRLRASGLPAPLHLLASLALYRHLHWSERLRLATGLAAMALGLGGPQRGATFAEWLLQSKQHAAQLRAFWEPFFVPALNAPLDCVSLEDGAFVLATAFLHDAGAARFGWSAIPLAQIAQAAAATLNRVHCSTAVGGVKRSMDHRRIALLVSGQWREFDGAILAVPPPQLNALLGDPQEYGVEHLQAYRSYPIIDVHLWHDRGSLGFEFAALLDSPVQWVFEKAPGYLCCSLSAAGDSMQSSTAELTRCCWDDVRTMVPGLHDGSLLNSAVTRNPDATFVCAPGRRRSSCSTAWPNLRIAGSWTDTGWPDTMESAVRSGRTAARSLETLCSAN
ncbi:MAG: hydroxysqualene dehydroxylase HpnE [Candidatus Baltobacteraceae bacterium]